MKTFMGGVVLGAPLVVSRGSPMPDDERTDRQKTVPVRLFPMPQIGNALYRLPENSLVAANPVMADWI